MMRHWFLTSPDNVAVYYCGRSPTDMLARIMLKSMRDVRMWVIISSADRMGMML